MRELFVVITVLNEHENIQPLILAVRSALNNIDYEVVFVADGSDDGTQKEIRNHAMGGIQLITFGILAEINVRTYFEGTNRKTYQVRRIFDGEKKTLEHN